MNCVLTSLILEGAFISHLARLHNRAGRDATFELEHVAFGIFTVLLAFRCEETSLLNGLVPHGALTEGPASLSQAFPLIFNVKTANLIGCLDWCHWLGICHISALLSITEMTHLHNARSLLSLGLLGHVDCVVFGYVIMVVGRFGR